MLSNLARTTALLAVTAAAAFVPARVDVRQALSNPQEMFKVTRACAQEAVDADVKQGVAGCKPNPGYICNIDHVQWIDKEPIIINTAATHEFASSDADGEAAAAAER